MLNQLKHIRPTSTFNSFKPQNSEQEKVVNGLQRLIQNTLNKLNTDGSLDNARLINLHGKPGRGKTHLTEAFVNSIKDGLDPSQFPYAEKVIEVIRGTNQAFQLKEAKEGSRILVVDDLFSDHQNLDHISDFDISCMSQGVLQAYERRQLVLTTSNFPTNSVIDKIAEKDTIGRISSRIKEMSISTIELVGSDYRDILAAERAASDDPFAL